MRKVLLALVILVTIPLVAWSMLNANFDLRKSASESTSTPSAPSTPPNYLFLTTDSLSSARFGGTYKKSEVSGYSTKTNAILSMTAMGLPAGLSLTDCTTSQTPDKKSINCVISGKVAGKPGEYSVRIILLDVNGNKGQIDTWLKLNVTAAATEITASPLP